MCSILKKKITNQWTNTQDTNMPNELDKYYQDRRDNMDRSGLFDPTPMWEQIQNQGLLPQRVNSSLNSGAVYYPNQNSMVAKTLNAQDTSQMEYMRDTLAHEYTHAWNENILKPLITEISAKEDRTPEEENFLKATKQLAGDIFAEVEPNKVLGALNKRDYLGYLEKLTGDNKIHRLKQKDQERQSYPIGEMTANAVVDPSYKVAIDEQGTHRNASVTTDYSILMDFVDRLPEATKKAAAQKRLEGIKEFPEGSNQKGWMQDAKQDLTNPFFKSWEKEFKNPLLK